MTTKIQVFNKLHTDLFDYVKQITDQNLVIPTVAETIIWLNSMMELNYEIDDLEAKYKQQLSFLESATDEQKQKIKRYLSAMFDLLK